MTKLTPGERAINWAKAIAIIVPLFGVGVFAGNTEIVHKFLQGPDDVVPVEIDYNSHFQKINAKFTELEGEIDAFKAISERDDDTVSERLRAEIRANRTKINKNAANIAKWHD